MLDRRFTWFWLAAGIEIVFRKVGRALSLETLEVLLHIRNRVHLWELIRLSSFEL